MQPIFGRSSPARRLARAVLILALAAECGCSSPAPPQNPVLEDPQAALQAVESRLRATPAPTHADWLELGMARYQVWHIFLARSRYPAGTGKARRKAADNRRNAERLEPKVIDAFERAANNRSDPNVAALAKVRLVLVYSEIPDLDKQIAMLGRILREHGDMDTGPFGPGRTPHYYCYYTLAGAWQLKGERVAAIDALARAMMALDKRQRAGVEVGDRPAMLLGRLLAWEPRLVLPRYQRLLPARIDDQPGATSSPRPAPALGKILRHHRETAPTRITVTVKHSDHNGLVVGYQVVFPSYPDVMAAWRKEQQDPRPLLGDEMRFKPTFRLSFATLPRTEGFRLSDRAAKALAPSTSTRPLVFDQDGRTAGTMILKWSAQARWEPKLYLTATLQRQSRLWGAALPPQEVYAEPVEVTLELLQ